MLFGRTDWERIQFNEKSLWTGDEQDTGAYQAFGDVYLKLDHDQATDYRRELDIREAVHRVSYRQHGVRFQRTALASHPANAIVLRMTADKPGAYSGRVWLTDMHDADIRADGNGIRSTGKLKNGLDYEAQMLILHEGGAVETKVESGWDKPLARNAKGAAAPDGRAVLNERVPGQNAPLPGVYVEFKNCDSVTLYLVAGTSYAPDHTRGWRGEHPHNRLAQTLKAVAGKPFADVLSEHQRDYRQLFDRVTLDLGATPSEAAALPTDRRLVRHGRVNRTRSWRRCSSSSAATC